jgi:hypothetical protein
MSDILFDMESESLSKSLTDWAPGSVVRFESTELDVESTELDDESTVGLVCF